MRARTIETVCSLRNNLEFPQISLHTADSIRRKFPKGHITTNGIWLSTRSDMQRGYGPPPAHSPPLHHPVPQHVSTVPQLRSPPPQSQQSYSSSPYGGGNMAQQPPQSGGSGFTPAFGGFMNDQTAQMGFQMGQSALKVGQDYVDQNVCLYRTPHTVQAYILTLPNQLNRYIPLPALKHYFNVSTSYVLRKLLLVLFPWRHKPWSRSQARPSSSPAPGVSDPFLPLASPTDSPSGPD